MAISPEQRKNFSVGIEEGPKENLLPPPPSVILVHENGQGNITQEIVTPSTWRDSQLIKIYRQRKQDLEVRVRNLPQFIEQVSQRKRKHGGERIPKKQRKGVVINLRREPEDIRAMISQVSHFIEGIGKKVDENAPRSNPRSPLELSVKVQGLGGTVEIRGEPLSKEDQEWLRFIREEAPEIWELINDQENFELLHQLFLARLAVRNADIDHQGREKAQSGLSEIIQKLSGIEDEKYLRLNPFVKTITDFFSRTTKSV